MNNREANNRYSLDDPKFKGSDKEFLVPEGYFKQLSADISNAIDADNETKIIPLKSYKTARIVGLLAAACLLAGIFILNIPKVEECETFACLLEKTEITDEDIEYLNNEEENLLFFDEDSEEEYNQFL